MTNTKTTASAPLAAEPITVDGQTAYRVPLSGRDGAGKFALLDAQGVEALHQAGARALYLVSDGHKHQYAAFLRLPSHHATTAARAVISAPRGRRVVYRNGDRLDLRTANLMIEPRKGEEDPRPAGSKAHDINQAWQARRRQNGLEDGAWKRTVHSGGGR